VRGDLDALVASGEAVIAPTPIVFNCSIVALTSMIRARRYPSPFLEKIVG
jgi:hypothetical protein